MMTSDNKVTLHDVAALAGVAARTVSRVVNREPGVSAKTADRVRSAIDHLGFRPNLAARALKSDRSLLIAIFNNNPSPHYVADVIRGTSKACREAGYFLTLEEFSVNQTDVAAQVADLLRSFRIAGAILLPSLTDDPKLLALLEHQNVPMVRLSPASFPGRTSAVTARDGDGIHALVDHLVALGHRSFGVISGPLDHASAQVRLDAFFAALARHGLGAADTIVRRGDYRHSSGVGATMDILDAGRPSVICAFNDEMAAGAISALGMRGIDVPRQIAVTGFDDSEIAKLSWPPLTTVRQSIVEQAIEATRLLIRQGLSGAPMAHVEQPVELVIRHSTIGAATPLTTHR